MAVQSSFDVKAITSPEVRATARFRVCPGPGPCAWGWVSWDSSFWSPSLGRCWFPGNPNHSTITAIFNPQAQHLLGTTTIGQDIFRQLVDGTRLSVLIGFTCGILSTLLAVDDWSDWWLFWRLDRRAAVAGSKRLLAILFSLL